MKKTMKQSLMMSILNFGSITLLVLTAIIFLSAVSMTNKVAVANDNRFDITLNANRFMDGSAYLTTEVRNYAANGNQVHFDNYWNEIDNLKNRDIGVENIKKIGITPEEQKKIDQMSELSNNLVPLESAAMDKVKAGNMTGAVNDVFGAKYEETIAQIRTIQSEFLTMLDTRAKSEVGALNTTSIVLQICTIVLIVMIIVFQTISAIVSHKKIIIPIKKVETEMQELAKGLFDSPTELEPDTSEIGMLINSMHSVKATLKLYVADISRAMKLFSEGNFMVQPSQPFIGDFKNIEDSIGAFITQMTLTLKEIKLASEQVASGSDQVSSGAQALSQGATEQASSIEELSATIAEISEHVRHNAENANQAKDKSQLAGGAVMDSNAQMKLMLEAMDEINGKSSEISKIVKTIEDIAFQTNILALNAAVEAARAGSAGKGFAVVADEVRNLAAKSAEAAQSTTMLIEETVIAVEKGAEIASQTASSMESVIEHASVATDLIVLIADASVEQDTAITQINLGVEQISAVIQTNSATAEESAAASEELSAQAEQMKSLVGRFEFMDI